MNHFPFFDIWKGLGHPAEPSIYVCVSWTKENHAGLEGLNDDVFFNLVRGIPLKQNIQGHKCFLILRHVLST